MQGWDIRKVRETLEHLLYLPGQGGMTETFWGAVLARNIIVAALVAEIYSPYLTWDTELCENAERMN